MQRDSYMLRFVFWGKTLFSRSPIGKDYLRCHIGLVQLFLYFVFPIPTKYLAHPSANTYLLLLYRINHKTSSTKTFNR